uniref:Uncharacterized protein n=1 Tax=Rhizophora mucronata TaxID=61149 RepID=A0A2P2J051_RHIMU
MSSTVPSLYFRKACQMLAMTRVGMHWGLKKISIR